jgi:hypothetical protein
VPDGYVPPSARGETPGVTDRSDQPNGQQEQAAPPSADDIDLDALAAAADAGDEEAREQIHEVARNLDINVDDEAVGGPYVAAANFAEAVAFVKAVQAGELAADGTDPNAPAEPVGPAVGDTAKYRLRDAKGNPLKDVKTKKERPAIDVEITAMVGEDACNVKNLETGKPVLGPDGKKPLAVKLSDLE